MEEVYVVRHRHLVEHVPIRQLSREMGIPRNTIRRYLRGAAPGVGKPRGIAGHPVRDAVQPRAEELLADSAQWTAGKQRLTAARLRTLLRAEGYDVGYTLVKEIVHEWKRRKQEVFVPLVYRPGDLAQVDFFEVLVDVEGTRRKAHMFVLRLMHSRRDFAWLYPRQDQTCFLDGHVRAFAHFGAVPHRLAYDNLKAAVAKHLAGSERELSPRFLALATHYCSRRASLVRGPDTTRAASRRAARASAGRSSCRFRRDRTSRPSAPRCSRGSMRAPRRRLPTSARRCRRCRALRTALRAVCPARRSRGAASSSSTAPCTRCGRRGPGST
jgi:transposase